MILALAEQPCSGSHLIHHFGLNLLSLIVWFHRQNLFNSVYHKVPYLDPVLFVLYTSPLASVIEKHSVLHHSYADNSQLQKSTEPSEVPQLLEAMLDCIADVRAWMTTNKLKLNNDKTEVMLPPLYGKLSQPKSEKSTARTLSNAL